MKIIGFQSGHDVSYCVLKDGVPILHNEWERFLRKKEAQGDGLKFLFDKEKDTGVLDDVDYFTHGNPRTRYGVWAFRYSPETGEFPCNIAKYDEMMKETGASFTEYSHHLSHAANAFFSSSYHTSLILSLDGGGWELKKDYENTATGKISAVEIDRSTACSVYIGQDTKIYPQLVHKAEEVNIGMLWDRMTRDVLGLSWGYPEGHGAGTMMAMAALGKYSEDLVSRIKSSWYSDENIALIKEWIGDDEQRRFDLAATIQYLTEDLIKNMINFWIKELKERVDYEVTHLCITGGVALNSVCVGKIQEWFPQIKDIYVPPVPYDAGLAIGSAQYLYHHILGQPRVKWDGNASPYLGRSYSEKEVMLAIKDHDLEFELVTDDDVIDLISKDDNIISVFGGGSESGRRALGNRSILADPRSKTMKGVINEKVKHRQSFRPFAPSILREEVSNWFTRDVNSPYMSYVLPFKDEVLDKVPAVCHVDNSARLQTVTEKDNLWYYNFIKKFGEKTGVPILLNTSFNDREPIVETPDNAISCFQNTDIDYLYFFDCGVLIKK